MKTNLMKPFSDDFLNRHFIGLPSVLDEFTRYHPTSNSFPPHNIIEVGETTTQVELAVAGFAPEDITVTVENSVLTIEGSNEHTDTVDDSKTYRYRGISTRSFVKSWRLAEYWEVEDATFTNGILTVTLVKEIPEEKKPKQIEIKTS